MAENEEAASWRARFRTLAAQSARAVAVAYEEGLRTVGLPGSSTASWVASGAKELADGFLAMAERPGQARALESRKGRPRTDARYQDVLDVQLALQGELTFEPSPEDSRLHEREHGPGQACGCEFSVLLDGRAVGRIAARPLAHEYALFVGGPWWPEGARFQRVPDHSSFAARWEDPLGSGDRVQELAGEVRRQLAQGPLGRLAAPLWALIDPDHTSRATDIHTAGHRLGAAGTLRLEAHDHGGLHATLAHGGPGDQPQLTYARFRQAWEEQERKNRDEEC
jgi:hypothetical protein